MYLYVAETTLEPLAKSIYQALRELRYPITLTHQIDPTSDQLYLLTGGQYVVDPPKNYIVIQTIPTSPLTLTQRIESYWISEEYLALLRNSIQIWDVSEQNCQVWREFYQFHQVVSLPIGYQSILSDGIHGSRNTDDPLEIYILNTTNRATQLVDRDFAKHSQIKLLDTAQPRKCIAAISTENCCVVLLNDYPDTYSPVELAIFYRANQIPCIIEAGLDTDVAGKLQKIGCHSVSRHRLVQYLKDLARGKKDTPVPTREVTKSVRSNTLSKLLQPHHLTYLPDPIQDGVAKSKTKKRNKHNELTLYNRGPIPTIGHTLLEDGGISVQLGEVSDADLPMLSVCTPTGNRRHLFALALRNFQGFIYPADKLEWVILDDGQQDISEIVPRSPNIRYHYTGGSKPRMAIGEKRNRLVELAKGEIIVMMDDDDFYSTQCLLSRAKSLLKYQDQGINCVGCTEVASYDLRKGYCAICSNGPEYLTESSLAFRRKFWEERKFRDTDRASEFRYFLEYRQDQLMTIPFQFVTVALTHGTNTTGGVRDLDLQRKWRPSEDWEKTKELMNSVFDEDTQAFLVDLKKQLPVAVK